MNTEHFIFLPWVRQGAINAITGLYSPRTSPSHPEISITAQAFDQKVSATDPELIASVEMKVQLFGPGDVTGFDPRQVIRTDPAPFTMDCEPNYFAAIEFDRPDFPWMFTPAKANEKQQLQPWICLVVVEKKEGALSPPTPGQPLPVLHVNDVKKELPNLEQAWAWAHSQIIGSASTVEEKITALEAPERNLSRLLCPRYLKPKTVYYACVVPTFEVGRKTGLGLKLDQVGVDKTLSPAWNVEVPEGTPCDLPVYYHWEFGTGAAGDFESLVRRLNCHLPEDIVDSIGIRPIHIGSPVPSKDPAQTLDLGEMDLEGALSASDPTQWHNDQNSNGAPQQKLEAFLQAIQPNSDLTAPVPDKNTPSILAPPLYGSTYANQQQIPGQKNDLLWFHQLNCNPCLRIAASLGTQIIQAEQEQLMASAWEQLSGVEEVNQAIRQAQMAAGSGTRLYLEYFCRMPDAHLLVITQSMHSRIRDRDPGHPHDQSTATIQKSIQESALPTVAVSSAFRRITRSRGPLARRVTEKLAGITAKPREVLWTAELLKQLSDRTINAIDIPVSLPAGLGAVSKVNIKVNINVSINPVHRMVSPLGAQPIQNLQLPSKERSLQLIPLSSSEQKPLNTEQVSKSIQEQTDPRKTILKRLQSQIEITDDPNSANPTETKTIDSLTPLTTVPQFPTPMYRALRDLSPDYLLPGLEKVPSNTIAAIYTNPWFIEAFIVGLNHEMGREFLWREYPADLRGTYFSRFWDRPPSQTDLKQELRDWENDLSTHLDQSSQEGPVILLIRGDFLSRYPRTLIYMTRAIWVETPGPDGKSTWIRQPKTPLVSDKEHPDKNDEIYPIFQGSVPLDVTFFGFDKTPSAARGSKLGEDRRPIDPNDAGWFFVIQQPPTEPRFGLDESKHSPEQNLTWSDLSWRNVFSVEDKKEIPDKYIRLSNTLDFPQPKNSDWNWNLSTNSAQLAAITLQSPFLVRIHAAALYGEE
jgi:hypothetical protein